MDDKYLILSDIHGNLSAFEAVLADCQSEDFAGVILLGDIIDYGMRSNEIVQKLVELSNNLWRGKIIVNIWGNHEKLVVDKDLERLSSDRGRQMAEYTARHLSETSIDYINCSMNKMGVQEFNISGNKCLAIHGSLVDSYWKAIEPNDLGGNYVSYDVVFSGHSHLSHFFTYFYRISNPDLRDKKAVMFINPGAVGQPRNQNPYAQYAILSFPGKRLELRTVKYDVLFEQSLYPKEVDDFYRNRLTYGI